MGGNMPTEGAFLEATTVRLGGKLGFSKLGPVLTRDRLADIDDALANWWNVPINDINGKRLATLVLLKACAVWDQKYQGNKSASRTGACRRIAVHNVVKQCKMWLVTLAPAASGNLKSLHPNYKAERSDYKTNKLAGFKVNPIGGTFVHGSQGADTSGLPDSVKKVLAKDMAQMTADDFRIIGKAFHIDDISQAQTKYMNKSERLNFLVQVKNGVFCDRDGNPSTEDMIYAMDKYGMLYGKPVIGLTRDIETAFFNHSSFMSGKDVICAGEITFNLTQWHLNQLGISDSRLLGKTLIDTASGHYQPDGANLKSCVLSLVHSGLNPNMHVAGSPHSSPSLPYQLAADLIR